MKKLIVFVLLFLSISIIVYAAANREQNTKSAQPATLYGKTSGGTLTPFLVDSNGVLQGG